MFWGYHHFRKHPYRYAQMPWILSRGDVISENPFWLIAALLLGIAFWHSTLARGASSVNRCDLKNPFRKGRGYCVWEVYLNLRLYIYIHIISLDYNCGLCCFFSYLELGRFGLFFLLSWVALAVSHMFFFSQVGFQLGGSSTTDLVK